MGCLLVVASSVPLLIFAGQVIGCRLARRAGLDVSPQMMAMACALASNGPVVVLTLALAPGTVDVGANWTTWVAIAGITNLLGYCYFHILNMSETARRIHILNEISSRGPLSLDRIREHYGLPQMVSVRIARLEQLGQLAANGERLVIRWRLLLWAARIVFWWARVLRLPATGPPPPPPPVPAPRGGSGHRPRGARC